MSGEESELRQRRGAAASSSSSAASEERSESPEDIIQTFSALLKEKLEQRVVSEGRATTREEIDRCVAEDMEKLRQDKKPLPGIKDDTKKAKDALAADPYNLDKIYALGLEYVKEEKWLQAMNVMIRGFKRVQDEGECPDREQRFEYLWTLCELSMKCDKYRQADACMRDIEKSCMPEEAEGLRKFYVKDCQIQSEIGRSGKGMVKAQQAFKTALTLCETFDEKAQAWMSCAPYLRKVQAGTVGYDLIKRAATTEENQKKLDGIDKWLELTDTIQSIKPSGTQNYLLIAVAVVLLCVFLWVLWWLEQRSLNNLKLKPP
jgi:hypothetical protein